MMVQIMMLTVKKTVQIQIASLILVAPQLFLQTQKFVTIIKITTATVEKIVLTLIVLLMQVVQMVRMSRFVTMIWITMVILKRIVRMQIAFLILVV